MQPQDSNIIDCLNRVLKNELTAINQYFLHSRMYKNWGLNALAEREYGEAVDEMKHADQLIERILMLEGLPNLQDLGRLVIGEDVAEMLRADLALERDAMPVLRECVVAAETAQDFVSRGLFEEILASEEDHVDWLETQLGLIDKTGLRNYVQSQIGQLG